MRTMGAIKTQDMENPAIFSEIYGQTENLDQLHQQFKNLGTKKGLWEKQGRE